MDYRELLQKYKQVLTSSMNKRHEIPFKSYDRLFPSQDTMPRGGLGNLIALPLQKSARKNNNSEFVNESFESYDDQWAFLSSIQKISESRIENLTKELCHGHELGVLKIDEEDTRKPWETHHPISLKSVDFPKQIDIDIVKHRESQYVVCTQKQYLPKSMAHHFFDVL